MEICVAHSRGSAVAVIVVIAFVGGFTWLSIDNLLDFRRTPWRALIASVLWIALVVFIIVMTIRGNGGIGRTLVQILGNFSVRQFVRIADDPQRGRAFSYGYRLFGRRFEYVRVSLDGIQSIGWSTGQASQMRRKDCDDWSVALWCDTERIQTRLGIWDRNDPQHIEIIGLSGARSETETLGRAIVVMLERGGLMLRSDSSDCRFERAT